MSKLIVANWKSHKNSTSAQSWWTSFQPQLASFSSEAKVVLCPPFSLLFELRELVAAEPDLVLGVQDLSPFPAGAYTGAISAENVESFGVRYAILGHSERRRYFHETHQEIANKVDQALQAGIKPILCLDTPYLAAQTTALSSEQLEQCIVAYEPIEAIGTGDEESVVAVTLAVEKIRQLFGQVPVIYGGSVSEKNAAGYFAVTDGVLVGTHSLESAAFASIVRQVESV